MLFRPTETVEESLISVVRKRQNQYSKIWTKTYSYSVLWYTLNSSKINKNTGNIFYLPKCKTFKQIKLTSYIQTNDTLSLIHFTQPK